MKSKLLALTTLVCIMALCPAESLSDTQPEQHVFSPELEAAIVSFSGTSAPALPDLTEKRKLIKRVTSSVPGRMHISRSIVVNKEKCRLYVKNALGDTLLNVPVCSSRNKGQKSGEDDWRTPEGTFPLYGLYNSTDWTYKDTDDKCYGPFFLSLKTQRYWGIGIHGTNAPGSVPGRRSHGCMRLHNENIIKVKSLVNKDLRVTVLPDKVTPATE